MEGNEDRIASRYYKEVGEQAIPTAAEERELFTQYRAACDGGNKARAERYKHRIACGYLKFVVQRAHRRTKNRELRMDLIEEGNVGLMVAIDKFDVDRGNRFLTYAASWIDVYMREFINRSLPVHMPNHKRKELRRARAAEDRLIALGVIRDYSDAEPSATSLDNVALAADADVEGEVQAREADVLAFMDAAALTLRERFVLVHHYGLRGGEGRNFRDIAVLFYRVDGTCLTGDAVRRLRDGALERLTGYLAAEGVARLDELV